MKNLVPVLSLAFCVSSVAADTSAELSNEIERLKKIRADQEAAAAAYKAGQFEQSMEDKAKDIKDTALDKGSKFYDAASNTYRDVVEKTKETGAATKEGLEHAVQNANIDKRTRNNLLTLIKTHPVKCAVIVAVVIAVSMYAKAIGVAIVSTAVLAIIIDLACEDSYVKNFFNHLMNSDTATVKHNLPADAPKVVPLTTTHS